MSESCVTSGFRRAVNEILALLGCYAAQMGSYRRCPETSLPDQRDLRCVTSQKSEDLSVFKGLEIGEESQWSRGSSRPFKMKLRCSFETSRTEYRVMRRDIPSECPQVYMFPSYTHFALPDLGGPQRFRRRTFRSPTLKHKADGVRNVICVNTLRTGDADLRF